MSLKWRIITFFERRFNRKYTKHAELYQKYIIDNREKQQKFRDYLKSQEKEKN